MQIGDPKRGMSLGGQVYVTLTNFCLQRTLHNRCRADSPIDLHPLHRMDPTATASMEPSTVLPAGDSILDTLGAEVLAAMSCSSSPPARPHATVLRGHDGCPEARRHAPRRDRLGRPHRCRDLDGDDMNVCVTGPWALEDGRRRWRELFGGGGRRRRRGSSQYLRRHSRVPYIRHHHEQELFFGSSFESSIGGNFCDTQSF
jgi:hypothetical protein